MKRFVDVVARTLPTSRLKEIAASMMLSEEEEYLLIERCAKQKTIDQCDRISRRRQMDVMPVLNSKIELWLLEDIDKDKPFLRPREIAALMKAFAANGVNVK